MSFARCIDVGLVFFGGLWVGLHLFFFGNFYVIENYAPTRTALSLYIVAAVLVSCHRDYLLKMFGFFWVVWPIVGSYYSLGTYFQDRLWAPLNLSEPNRIYLFGIIMLLFGQKFVVLLWPVPEERRGRIKLRPLFALPLIIFPAVYAIVLFYTGNTIIHGGNILYEMYETDRGPIYALRIALPMVMVFFYLRTRESAGWIRILYISALVVTLFISILDGKRDMALIGVLSLVFLFIAEIKRKVKIARLVAGLLMAILFYGVVGNLRAERQTDISSWLDVVTIAGTEYREFAYSVNYWTPKSLETFGYDYVGSAIGALVNRQVLRIFNLEKDELIASDSARAWQRASGAEFGIRTGLVSELYFAFPIMWWALLTSVGVVAALLRSWMVKSKSEIQLIMSTIFFASLTTAIMSQSSAVLGYILTSIYIVVALKLWAILWRLTPHKYLRYSHGP